MLMYVFFESVIDVYICFFFVIVKFCVLKFFKKLKMMHQQTMTLLHWKIVLDDIDGLTVIEVRRGSV